MYNVSDYQKNIFNALYFCRGKRKLLHFTLYKLISYAPGENYESLPRRIKLVVVYVHVVINLIALGLTLYGKKNLNFFASRIE